MLKLRSLKAKMAITTVLLFLFSFTGTVFAADSYHYSYVALGDSLAAGQTPFGVENGYGYTNVIQNDLAKAGVSGGYHNFGKSGLTAKELLDQLTPENANYNANMVKALKDADIITLDIGANDLLNDFRAVLAGKETSEQFLDNVQATLTNIGYILYNIRTINPNAKVYVMGYYDALVNLLTPDQHNAFVPLLSLFNNQLQAISNSNGCEFVSTYGFVTTDELPGDIHPTRDGYKAIAGQFWTTIQSDGLIPAVK